MTVADLKFIQIPGSETWVAVHRIRQWAPHPTSPGTLTCVWLDDRDDYIAAWCTHQEFAALIRSMLDGPPPERSYVRD